MNAQPIDLTHSPRRDHFAYFIGMADPYVGLTANVDISGFVELCKAQGFPFFLSFLYCVGQAANSIPELRQRIVDGTPVCFRQCDTSHTVMRENGAYGYCRLQPMQPFDAFLREAIPLHEQAKAEGSLEDGEDAASLLFISSIPWIHYSALRQPTPCPADSNPRITWGKFQSDNGKTTIPVTLLAHHALVDGVHIAAFYQALEQTIRKFMEDNA